MKIKILTLVGVSLIATTLLTQAGQQTTQVNSTRIDVRSINDNMMGFRPEPKYKASKLETVDPWSKPIYELFAPAATMVTDAELNNYFLYGSARLGFTEYFALKLSNGERFLCPTEKLSGECEKVSTFKAHGKSEFVF
ncbi:hypothetical protein [Rheinheimera hassiensis]|uniref:hypothetical protein n=1 Tax=Rheinheimera hassiensis TaxID=1193627 RepID=UPI001F05A807|nr:hypothetical protein [Rheinheimera hassiensis]